MKSNQLLGVEDAIIKHIAIKHSNIGELVIYNSGVIRKSLQKKNYKIHMMDQDILKFLMKFFLGMKKFHLSVLLMMIVQAILLVLDLCGNLPIRIMMKKENI